MMMAIVVGLVSGVAYLIYDVIKLTIRVEALEKEKTANATRVVTIMGNVLDLTIKMEALEGKRPKEPARLRAF